MRQLSLAYRPARTGRDSWAGTPGMPGTLDILRAAVDHLGWKEVLFELDIGKSTLSEALGEKNDKRWAGEWTSKVLAMLARRGDEKSREIGRAIFLSLLELMPCFALVDADDEPTDEEIEVAQRVLDKRRRARRRAA